MGDGLTPPPTYHAGQQEETRTLGEYVADLTAYYMAIGMPRDLFLYGDRTACEDYELAYEYKQVNENRMLHLQGFYDYYAVSCALSSAFSEKGKKGTPYLDHPVPITETEKKAEKQRNIRKTLAWVRGRKRDGGRS